MNFRTVLSSLLFLSIMTLSSCSKDKDELKNIHCDFNLEKVTVEPICNFNPSLYTTVIFPVRILSDGENIHHSEYDFQWSSDPNFKSNAISISYDKLPLSVIITERSTGCIVDASLDKSYWD